MFTVERLLVLVVFLRRGLTDSTRFQCVKKIPRDIYCRRIIEKLVDLSRQEVASMVTETSQPCYCLHDGSRGAARNARLIIFVEDRSVTGFENIVIPLFVSG